MVTRKDKKHSGYYTPRSTCNPRELKEQNLEINEEYSDWRDWRDSLRDWYRDFKQIKNITKCYKKRIYNGLLQKRNLMNKKQIKLLIRRKLRKTKNGRIVQ